MGFFFFFVCLFYVYIFYKTWISGIWHIYEYFFQEVKYYEISPDVSHKLFFPLFLKISYFTVEEQIL